MEPKFKNAQVGDKVWSFTAGPGKVDKIVDYDKAYPYPLRVMFDSGGSNDYALNGTLFDTDIRPDLYWSERVLDTRQDQEPIRRPVLPVDAAVLVKGRLSNQWVKRHFSRWQNDCIKCFTDGKTSWTAEAESLWDYWKLPDGRTNCPEETTP